MITKHFTKFCLIDKLFSVLFFGTALQSNIKILTDKLNAIVKTTRVQTMIENHFSHTFPFVSDLNS